MVIRQYLFNNVNSIEGLYHAMTKLHGDKKLRDTQLRNARKEYVSKFNFETIIENTFMRYYKASES